MSSVKNVLCGIASLEVYPIVALVLFALVFAGAACWAFTLKKTEAAALCRMPLEDSTPDGIEGDLR